MKKISFSILALFILFTNSLSGQEKGNKKVSIGYGYLSNILITSSLLDVFVRAPISLLGKTEEKNKRYGGTFLLAYEQAITNNIEIGLDLAFEQVLNDVVLKSTDSKIGEQTNHFYLLAVKTNYNLINDPNFALYFGLGLGYTYVDRRFKSNETTSDESKQDNLNHFNFHITALGVRFGEKIFFSSEIGYGYRGLINASVGYRFNKPKSSPHTSP